MPLGVAAFMAAVMMPASMYLQGTSMGAKIHSMRSRCFGAFGVVDPWAKALQHAADQQDRFEKVVLPSLENRPNDPTVVIDGVSREQQTQEWSAGIVERMQYPIAASLRAQREKEIAERNVAREDVNIMRKNRMIKNNLPPATRTDPDAPHKFDDKE
jgi:hypothetical protein